MRVIKYFGVAWQSIQAHRMRAILTMLGIIIGIAAVLVTVGIGSGAAASITAPIIANMSVNPVFAALAACVGSLFYSYFNDSFFWVVAEFSEMDVATAYKSQTIATLIQGLVTITVVAILAWLLL